MEKLDAASEALARVAAFRFLEDLVRRHGDDLHWSDLREGFEFEGERIGLVGTPGIFKPKVFTYPISIRTAAEKPGVDRPYEDEWVGDTLLYKYRGRDPESWDNRALRAAMTDSIPLIHFQGVTSGRYAASWPVYISGDDVGSLTFAVSAIATGTGSTSEVAERSYAHRLTRHRLHQARFRQRILHAYREHCAVCRLRRRELLDAAHILRDSHELGRPVVSNGLSLCKLHHAAFDQNLVGVRPDFVVEIKPEVLEQQDGPMLVHGLQGFQGSELLIPERPAWHPDREALAERYEEFRSAG